MYVLHTKKNFPNKDTKVIVLNLDNSQANANKEKKPYIYYTKDPYNTVAKKVAEAALQEVKSAQVLMILMPAHLANMGPMQKSRKASEELTSQKSRSKLLWIRHPYSSSPCQITTSPKQCQPTPPQKQKMTILLKTRSPSPLPSLQVILNHDLTPKTK